MSDVEAVARGLWVVERERKEEDSQLHHSQPAERNETHTKHMLGAATWFAFRPVAIPT